MAQDRQCLFLFYIFSELERTDRKDLAAAQQNE
jgi:hypothetical protein